MRFLVKKYKYLGAARVHQRNNIDHGFVLSGREKRNECILIAVHNGRRRAFGVRRKRAQAEQGKLLFD